MNIETQISDHILKEDNLQSTPLYKLFPEAKQFYEDFQIALNGSPKNQLSYKRTPHSKTKVKRNLNDSFSNTPQSNSKNISQLNYSILSENESGSELVLRFRLSKSRPYVDLKRSNEIKDKLANLPESQQFSRTVKKTRRISFADEKSTVGANEKASVTTRKSLRSIERKSYVELLSPEKIPDDILAVKDGVSKSFSLNNRDNAVKSPAKRLHSQSVDTKQCDPYKTKLLNTSREISPKKRGKPRRALLTQQLYKELISDDDPDLYESDSPFPSPKKRGRSRRASVTQQSYQESFYDGNQDLYGSDSPFSSPKKRGRPRRASVTQQSYKESFTEDDQDPYGSDNVFSSPVKSRSKRNIKIPAKYADISDDIIHGVKKLAMSDDENEILCSPKKKSKSLVNTPQREGTLLSYDRNKVEQVKDDKNYRWRTTCKSSRSSNKNAPSKLGASLSRKSTTSAIPHTPNRKTNISVRPILHNTPSKVKSHKEIKEIPTTALCSDKVPNLSSIVNRTPKNPRSKPSPSKTATNSLRLMRAGVLMPTVQSRVTAVKGASTPLNKARLALHVGHVPDALPCREREAEDIYGFVRGKLLDECGGCMYISGVPGTGKTATITYVILQLQDQCKRGELPEFQYVSVNGMRLTEPRQSYVEILKQLTGKIVPWEQAQNQLNSKFTKKGQASKPIVLMIDELDILCTKRQDVVYNLLDWPSKAFCQLIIVTIANTMDLPERLLMGRVASRLGLTRLTFQAYNYKQLQEIVTKRISDSKTFHPDAIQLVARKVASVSGDARRALDICRRAAEMAEVNGNNTLVSMEHVNESLETMMTQPKIRAIKSSSRLQKLLLQSVVAEIERTGVEEASFATVFKMFSTVAAIDGFAMVSMTIAMAAIAKLGYCKLLLLDQKISGLYQRIMLNVSVDDVYYALKSE